jgi:hypothetical protein
MMDFVFLSIGIAIVAFVYTEILTEQGMILNWLHSIITKLPATLHKPLISCAYCVSGQMALWLFLYLNWSDYSLLKHVMFVSLTIFFTHVIMTANYKLNRYE